MSEVNWKEIIEACPTIYRDSMYFECGAGWFDIIKRLSLKVEELAKAKPEFDFTVVQVKEKFGGLRFYMNQASDEMYDAIGEAEKEAEKTCETCGAPGKCLCFGGWYVTLCPTCEEKRLGES